MMQPNPQSITFQNVAGDWRSSPRILVTSSDQLESLLGSLSKSEPGIVNLESSTKDLLQLGIGGQFASAQFTTHDAKPRYLCAKAKTIRTANEVEFLCGGTPTPISPQLCISFEEAVSIADYFLKSGDRHPDFEWVEV